MSDRNTTLGKQIGTLFDLGALGAMPDRDLLAHCARGGTGSEAAFASLVERHGPMVLRVCRHVLADSHLAEDAFQVTFVLLARRACSIHDPDALAGWLHRVARRVAVRARARIRRRGDREGPQTDDIAIAADNPLERDELCAIVHEEIDRLVDVQRLPILLCASRASRTRRQHSDCGGPSGRSRAGWSGAAGVCKAAWRGVAWPPRLRWLPAFPACRPPRLPCRWCSPWPRRAQPCDRLLPRQPPPPPLSASIALLLQRELTAMFLAKVRLAAGAAFAGAAAILFGITLAGPLFGRGQQIVPRRDETESPPSRAKIIVAGTDLPTAPRTDSRIPRNPELDPGGEQGIPAVARPKPRLSAFGKKVEDAIKRGVDFLKAKQRPDGSWTDVEMDAKTGATSLVTLALLAGDEKPESPAIRKALEYLRRFKPVDLKSTYAISLQTMAFAAALPEHDRLRIAANVHWLEARPDQARRPSTMARFMDLLRHEA